MDGEWFARVFTWLLGTAGLASIALVLYAAVRGLGRWLGVW